MWGLLSSSLLKLQCLCCAVVYWKHANIFFMETHSCEIAPGLGLMNGIRVIKTLRCLELGKGTLYYTMVLNLWGQGLNVIIRILIVLHELIIWILGAAAGDSVLRTFKMGSSWRSRSLGVRLWSLHLSWLFLAVCFLPHPAVKAVTCSCVHDPCHAFPTLRNWIHETKWVLHPIS